MYVQVQVYMYVSMFSSHIHCNYVDLYTYRKNKDYKSYCTSSTDSSTEVSIHTSLVLVIKQLLNYYSIETNSHIHRNYICRNSV